MNRVLHNLFAVVTLTQFGSPAYADLCDYRPSQLVGGAVTATVATAAAGVGSTGAGMTAAGFYTLTHAATGATMLGSVAGGASAAGTVGIMGGTGGAVGGTAAFLMAPITIIVGAVTAVGIIGYEGSCYFHDERVTDFSEVLARMQSIEANSQPDLFDVYFPPDNPYDVSIRIRNLDGSISEYLVRDLYIVNGVLMNRDWFTNTVIGQVGYVNPQQ